MRKEFETIAQYKEQMRAMLDKAEAEKRALDASEKEQFEQLKTKKELLEMKVERRALEDINAGLVTVACCFHRLFLTSLIIALWKNTTE